MITKSPLLWIFIFAFSAFAAGQIPSPTPLIPDPTRAIDSLPIGKLPVKEAILKLEELGDKDDIKDLKAALKRSPNKDVTLENLNFEVAERYEKRYKYATRVFGFVPATAPNPSVNLLDITAANNIEKDNTLKGKSIKITLDRLRVADYPGDDIHLVLFEFSATHQAADQAENLNFNQTYRVPEGEGAGIIGNPVFLGLKVKNEGISFKFKTTNVSNEDDEKFLAFLGGNEFTRGLQLINAVNPLVPVVSEFAVGIAKTVASRNKNVSVQEVNMGLDFTDNVFGARLREGSYIAVQAPEGEWDWSKWKFKRSSGEIVSADDKVKNIPYNYVVFSISKMQ